MLHCLQERQSLVRVLPWFWPLADPDDSGVAVPHELQRRIVDGLAAIPDAENLALSGKVLHGCTAWLCPAMPCYCLQGGCSACGLDFVAVAHVASTLPSYNGPALEQSHPLRTATLLSHQPHDSLSEHL